VGRYLVVLFGIDPLYRGVTVVDFDYLDAAVLPRCELSLLSAIGLEASPVAMRSRAIPCSARMLATARACSAPIVAGCLARCQLRRWQPWEWPSVLLVGLCSKGTGKLRYWRYHCY
jgi:hypothetical protein